MRKLGVLQRADELAPFGRECGQPIDVTITREPVYMRVQNLALDPFHLENWPGLRSQPQRIFEPDDRLGIPSEVAAGDVCIELLIPFLR